MSEKRLGVVIIDMQEYFVRQLYEDERASLIANQKRILQSCQKNKIPVVQVEWFDEGETINELGELIMECERYIFIKNNNDAFKATNGFDDILKLARINQLLVMGINLSACVFETVMSARKHGYEIIIHTDLVANAKDISRSCTESALCIMKKNAITVNYSVPIL